MPDKRQGMSRLEWYFNKLIWNTHMLHELWQGLLVIAVYTLALVYFKVDIWAKPSTMVHSILGLALGLLLVFRTNTAYDRWWEGRKLLGALVNNSRNIAIKISTYFDTAEDKEYMSRMASAYAFALKSHLRDGDAAKRIFGLHLITETEYQRFRKLKHVPNEIARCMYELATQRYNEGSLKEMQFLSFEKHLAALTDIIGGCERIKKTPMPLAYGIHLRQFLNLYIFSLPFNLVHALGYWTVPLLAVTYYALAGLKEIGEEIEEPFGTDNNDLPVNQIAHTIYNNIYETTGVTQPKIFDEVSETHENEVNHDAQVPQLDKQEVIDN
ncbi:bestrophin family protein [uncultured Microscilla sp.]|uniref:bestrophin family protein n=1 Tax=uncultured Microscilla sp. TaxID=432653 RepID=UPI00262B4990|nr:bestrophin family ion channel [uncultured Microscilla sp.]